MIRKTVLPENSLESDVLKESIELLEKKNYPEDETAQFINSLIQLLDSLRDHFGAGYPLKYQVGFRMGKVRTVLYIDGKKFDCIPGNEGIQFLYDLIMKLLLSEMTVNVTDAYLFRRNIYTVISPRLRGKKMSLKSPLLWSVVLGIVCGLFARRLPEGIRHFLVYDLADPLSSLILGLMTGIMGPIIFFSMVNSITTLETIDRLTDLGFKIVLRFLKITLFIIAVSIGVSLLFYSGFGSGSLTIDPGKIVMMLLDLIPQNVFTPFTENNTPQLVILGFVMGAALLLLGDEASQLKTTLLSVQDWFMIGMDMIYTLTPAIPFLSIFRSFAEGNEGVLFNGWEFILAVFLSFLIVCLCKLIKVSVKCRIRIPVLIEKIRPTTLTAFSAGSEAAAMKLQIEDSKSGMGIRRDLCDFWIPMSQAMFRPRTTVHLVIAPFLIAKYAGISISQTFLFVLIILSLELSVASAGITSAWTILFAALNLPMEYVGIFVIYKVFTTNFSAAGSMFYYGLEQIEAAYDMNALDRSLYES